MKPYLPKVGYLAKRLPTYDEVAQYLVVDTAVVQGDKVIVTYKAVDFEG